MAEEKKKEEKNIYELVEVPTQTALVVKNNSTEEVYDNLQLMVLVLNKLEKIEKAVC